MNARTNAARNAHPAAPRRLQGAGAAPAIPRRVSGPAARPVSSRVAALPASSRPAAVPAGTRAHPGLLAGAAALPDHRLLDRLLRGRLWIWCIGLALGGIVAMQVSLLKLNTGISRAVQTSGTLEMQNASLQAGIARLSAQERIQAEVVALGMQFPEAGDLEHVEIRGRVDAGRAVARMAPPSDLAHERLAVAAAAAAAGSAAASSVGGPAAAPVIPSDPTTPPAPGAAPATSVAPVVPVTPTAASPSADAQQG